MHVATPFELCIIGEVGPCLNKVIYLSKASVTMLLDFFRWSSSVFFFLMVVLSTATRMLSSLEKNNKEGEVVGVFQGPMSNDLCDLF